MSNIIAIVTDQLRCEVPFNNLAKYGRYTIYLLIVCGKYTPTFAIKAN